jgi:hypothetical protein
LQVANGLLNFRFFFKRETALCEMVKHIAQCELKSTHFEALLFQTENDRMVYHALIIRVKLKKFPAESLPIYPDLPLTVHFYLLSILGYQFF